MAAVTGITVNPPTTTSGGSTAPAAPHIYSAGELEALWINAGGDPTWAIPMAAVALAESGGNPLINYGGHVGRVAGGGSTTAAGLWQILGLPFQGDVYDPATNAKMAVSKFKSAGGPGPWATYANGSYKTFMARATQAFKDTFHALPGSSPSAASVNTALYGIPGFGGVVAGSQGASALGIPNPLKPIEQIAAVLARFADLLTSTEFWIRLGEGLAAMLLLYLGLHALVGQSSTPGQQVKHVTRIIPI